MVARSSLVITHQNSGCGRMEEMIRIGLMNNLPEFFKQTSDAPYDRHWYKIWCTDNSVKIVESYEEVQTAWWNFKHFISHIEVIDAKRNAGSGRGFA